MTLKGQLLKGLAKETSPDMPGVLTRWNLELRQ